MLYVICQPGSALDSASSLPPPTERWYCRSCWLREPLRVYAYNDAGAEQCKVCSQLAGVAGCGHWVRDAQVPRRLLRNWDRDHSDPEVRVLRMRWPKLELLQDDVGRDESEAMSEA